MQTALTIALQLALIALPFVSSRRMSAGTWNDDYLSLSQTKGLQGLLALIIVFHHCGQKVMYSYLGRGLGFTSGLTIVSFVGFMLVGYFFFCSGYGLFRSYHDKEYYLDGFLKRRPLALLAIFYACNTLYLVGRLALGETFVAPRLVRLCLGIELANPNAWYAIALPLMYVLFYFSARNIEDDKRVVRRLFVGVSLYVLVGMMLTMALSGGGYLAFSGIWWYDSVILFPVGYVYGLKKDAITAWMKRNYTKSVALSLLLWIGGFVPSAFLSFMPQPDTTALALYVVSLVKVAIHYIATVGFVWAMIVFSLKWSAQGRVLAFYGAITLELYLMHGFFVQIFHPPFFDSDKGILEIAFVPAFILAVLTCGTLAALLFRVLTKKLLGRK